MLEVILKDGLGKFSLVDALGNDKTVVQAARVSFNRHEPKDQPSSFTHADARLIKYLAANKHMSPFRHVQLQMVIEDIPEYVMRQLFRHQVGCDYTSGDFREIATVWNEISGRYVNLDEVGFHIPAVFRAQSDDNKQASVAGSNVGGDEARRLYAEAVAACRASYSGLRKLGVCREQARAVLPLCFRTGVTWTASLEAAVHFVRLRKHAHAQAEIRVLAEAVEAACNLVAPRSTAALLGS